MKWILYLLVPVIFILVIVAVTYKPVEKEYIELCVKSHEEQYTWLMPVVTGFINGIPIYTYIPQQATETVCDEYQQVKNPKYREVR